jgi:FMN phosphatase YigB (HAD superfamily)
MTDLDALKALLDQCEAISFDFFDTLVTRQAASPEAVQQYVGFRLSHETAGLEGFYDRRVLAEQSARLYPYVGDVDLNDIYAEFPLDEHWTAEAIERARVLERGIDSRFVIPRPAVAQLLVRAKGAGKRVIVVTDSYYPRSLFEELLDRFGWSTLVDAIYVSSEHRARKDSGTLWSVVAEREYLSGKRFVHVGDNPRSDQETALAAGLASVLVPNPSIVAAQRGIRHEPGRHWRADILLGPLVARWGSDPFSSAAPIADAHELGYVVYGPILIAFFAWLAHHPAVRRMERLFFSSREGHFLRRLYERLREYCGLRDLPPATYLPMSRRAAIMASLARAFDPARVTDYGGFQGSVEALLGARLGYVLNWASRLAVPVRLPEDRSYVQRLLEILKTQLLERAEVERTALVSYAESLGLGAAGEIGLVDIGYSGTIQGLLQLVLGRPLSGFYMATAPGAASVRATGGEAYGCFQDPLRGDLRPEGFQRKTVLLEALLTAPHGQLSHFEPEEGGRARPVFMENGVSQRTFSMLERVFEGALEYCTTVIDTAGIEVLEAIGPARASALLTLDAVFEGGVKVSEPLARALYMEDAFCGNGEVSALPSNR